MRCWLEISFDYIEYTVECDEDCATDGTIRATRSRIREIPKSMTSARIWSRAGIRDERD